MENSLESSVRKRKAINRGIWADNETLVFPDVSFDVTVANSATHQSTPEKFVLVKSRRMIEYYQDLLSRFKIQNIFEIGIFKGGGMVFFYKLCKPNKIVAIEIERDANPALAEFITRSGLTKVLRPIYGVNQADAVPVRRVIEEEFGETQIDLIIDDGCHFLDETRKSFNTTFQYLREGGFYVIEDWGWAHWPGMWQQNGGPWKDRPATSFFIFELAMLAASRPDVIEKLEIFRELVLVRKGNIQDLGYGFDISKFYLTAGRTFLEQGFPLHGIVKVIQASLSRELICGYREIMNKICPPESIGRKIYKSILNLTKRKS